MTWQARGVWEDATAGTRHEWVLEEGRLAVAVIAMNVHRATAAIEMTVHTIEETGGVVLAFEQQRQRTRTVDGLVGEVWGWTFDPSQTKMILELMESAFSESELSVTGELPGS